MAEAIVSAVIEQMGSVMQQELEQEMRIMVGIRKEVKKLITTLTIIKPVIEDAEVKQVMDDSVKIWLAELKDVVYDVDDVLDEWKSGILVSKRIKGVNRGNSSFAEKVFFCFSCPCYSFQPVYDGNNIAQRIKTVREKLDVIAYNKDKFNLIENRIMEVIQQRSISILDVAEVHGRDDEKELIMSSLLAETSSQQMDTKVPVVAIVGIGGLGKTTLAQLVLKEEKLMTRFQLMMWICVSGPIYLQRVAMEIIKQATGKMPEEIGWENLLKHLSKSVEGKVFLLVLDDVSAEGCKDWNSLKLSLDGAALGSRILVTTRDGEVAKSMNSINTHMLKQLSEEDSWSLFRSITFFERSEGDSKSFEDVGKEIAKKCKGVPLAVKTVASLTRLQQTKHGWKNVLESGIWNMQQLQKGFLPALLLSYHALPSYLKQCFMYCAIFPKDTLRKDNLIKLWMAQGFLGSDGGKELEMIGRDYFNELAMRSFFQDFEKDDNGNIITFKMHDLIHHFSEFLTTTECTVLEKNTRRRSSNKVRHINTWNAESLFVVKANNLRTLIVQSSPSALLQLFYRQTCLRALGLSRSDVKELPREVNRLTHLRFLDLSYTPLKELPETVSDLYNLQTLNLNHCRRLCKLPERIGELSNLRHFEIEGTYALGCFSRGIGRLSCLQTLCKFILSSASGGCTIRELKNLNCLSGELEIIGIKQVENPNDAKQAELQNKKNLHSLSLDFECFSLETESLRENVRRSMEVVLESLQPHKNLEKLQIIGYSGSIFPSWISRNSLLSNIVTLKLFKCKECSQLPALGGLSSLECLTVENLESVKHIGLEFYGHDGDRNEVIVFPNLKKLQFIDMKEWEDWHFPFPKYKKIMPSLCDLTLRSCPKLNELPPVGKLESLERMFICGLSSVRRMGIEFFGIPGDCGVSEEEKTFFPVLKKLEFVDMQELEEWYLPFSKDIEILRHLSWLELRCCEKLKAIPALGMLKSLETLKFSGMKAVQRLGSEFLGLTGDSRLLVVFPNLTCLTLEIMPEWEEEDSFEASITSNMTIMPRLQALEISWCRKLKLVPHYMFAPSLKKLSLTDCPQLTGMQPHLPQQLEELMLDRDVGVVSRSLPLNSNNNLKYLAIHSSPYTTLPQGLGCLMSLEELQIFFCKVIDFMTEELEHLGSLYKLEIRDCPVLVERCRGDWSILSHVACIVIDFKLIA